MKLTEAKSNLGRLMAEENILIEMRKGVQTAFFDTESRLLVVPEFKEDLSVNVLDLFISHEAAHACFTPNDEWKNAVRELKINKSILNVCEDARIEILIKQKYPGLRKIFHFAYKELFDNDFFGTSYLDINNLNLIDRINLYFKVGFMQFITFSEEEQEMVNAVEATKTFSDVVEISKVIQEYMKSQYEKENENFDAEGFEFEFETLGMSFDEGEMGGDDYDGEMDGLKGSLNNGMFNESDGASEAEKEARKKEKLERAIDSATAKYAEQKIKEMFSESNKDSVYIDLPQININEYVIPYSKVYKRLKDEVGVDYIDKTAYNNFKNENSSVVSYLIKEFQLKKNAEGRKKSKISKTGDINLNKLFAYKVSDDIFKRTEIVPKHQSHGLVFFLDWSGSMEDCMNDTIKQLITMLMFCRRLNIPFEVYTFTTQYYESLEYNQQRLDKMLPKNNINKLILYGMKLLNIFSSKMSNNQFIEACNYLLCWQYNRFSTQKLTDRWSYYTHNSGVVPWFSLGNTPLNHSIMLSKKVIEAFKENNKVQKINCIFLTDGDSHSIDYGYINNGSDYAYSYTLNDTRRNVYLRDKETKVSHKIKITGCPMSETNSCVDFLKQISDFRVFGFRLIGSREFNSCSSLFFNPNDDLNSKRKEFTKSNCIKSTKTSFDEFYLVKMNSINAKDETFSNLDGTETSSAIAKKFQKTLTAKVNNRVFLTNFIKFIS